MNEKRIVNERLGQIGKNHFKSIMEIVEYYNTSDIWVKFEQGNLKHTSYGAFCKGDVKNVYDSSVYGVGYLGEGDYKGTINGKITKQYSVWLNMLQRCYDEEKLKRSPTYKDCSVCDDWHNFQTFAKWYDENYYDLGERMCLDKDILNKGNKIYCPEECIFVPASINTLFVKNNARRGKYPIGVSFNKRSQKYTASSNDGRCGGIKELGSFSTPEEAFNTYKTFREDLIKSIANEYINRIPNKLYVAMQNYIIEITD